MILQCPSCTSRFLVADALIPIEGRTVKCGKCAHQWFTTRDAVAPPLERVPLESDIPNPVVEAPPPADFAALTAQAYEEATPLPFEPKQLPTVQSKPFPLAPFKIAVPLLAASWLILAIFAYFPSGQRTPVLRGFYSAIGVTDTRDLVFADVSMDRQYIESRTRFLISGSIANHGTTARSVPKVRVQVKDADGKVIWQQTYAVNETVKPGELYPFRIDNVETSFASRAASIVLDLGNSFELVMR